VRALVEGGAAPVTRSHVSFFILSTLVLGLACSDGEVMAPDLPSRDPVQAALSAIEGSSSYHLEVTPSPPVEDPLRSTRFVMEFVAPDTFRVVSTRAEGVTKQVCATGSLGDSTSEVCRDVLDRVTGHTTFEAVWNRESIFLRECDGALPACSGDWQQVAYLPELAPSVGPAYADLPNWHLEAVQGAHDIQPVEGQGTAGPLLHFEGRYNPIRVFVQAARSFYGEEAVSVDGGCGVSGSVDLRPDSTPEIREECRSGRSDSLTELAEAYDLRPVPIDIWLSPTDSTIQRILAVVPQPLPGDAEISVDVEFSRLNEVRIEVPPRE
jgi:hypothetical protein